MKEISLSDQRKLTEAWNKIEGIAKKYKVDGNILQIFVEMYNQNIKAYKNAIKKLKP